MKTIKVLFAMLFAFATFQSVNAQSGKTQRIIGIKTQTIHVSGTCSMDKRRIENAAYSVEGIKSAVWDEYTQVLTLKYSVFRKEAADKAQRNIALAGNETEKYRENDMAYENLPDCCHYKRQRS